MQVAIIITCPNVGFIIETTVDNILLNKQKKNTLNSLLSKKVDFYWYFERETSLVEMENSLFNNIEVFFNESKQYWIYLLNKYMLEKLNKKTNNGLYKKLLESFYTHLKATELWEVSSTKISGLYLILEKSSSICYIGESKDIFNRLGQHKKLLLSGQHHNYFLQKHFTTTDITNFEFLVLLFNEDLKSSITRKELEQQFIKNWPGKLFNILGNPNVLDK